MNVLVISPHPDDESIGCGGTIRKHVVEGDQVSVLFLTSGEKGGKSGIKEEGLMSIRENESIRAKEILGFNEIDFWRLPDGNVQVTRETLERLVAKISAFQPLLIFVPNEHEAHADHRAAAGLVRQAVCSLPQTIQKPRVFMYEVWTPVQKIDYMVDISPFLEEKRAAIKAHDSQCNIVKYDEAILSLNRYRGEMHSWPGGDYAEVFEKMNL